MSQAIEAALKEVHTSLNENNVGLDNKIAALKTALETAGQKQVAMDATLLPQNNRQGRKMLQTYFKKRGVVVEFSKV